MTSSNRHFDSRTITTTNSNKFSPREFEMHRNRGYSGSRGFSRTPLGPKHPYTHPTHFRNNRPPSPPPPSSSSQRRGYNNKSFHQHREYESRGRPHHRRDDRVDYNRNPDDARVLWNRSPSRSPERVASQHTTTTTSNTHSIETTTTTTTTRFESKSLEDFALDSSPSIEDFALDSPSLDDLNKEYWNQYIESVTDAIPRDNDKVSPQSPGDDDKVEKDKELADQQDEKFHETETSRVQDLDYFTQDYMDDEDALFRECSESFLDQKTVKVNEQQQQQPELLQDSKNEKPSSSGEDVKETDSDDEQIEIRKRIPLKKLSSTSSSSPALQSPKKKDSTSKRSSRNKKPARIISDDITEYSSQETPLPSRTTTTISNSSPSQCSEEKSSTNNNSLLISLRESPQKTKSQREKQLPHPPLITSPSVEQQQQQSLPPSTTEPEEEPTIDDDDGKPEYLPIHPLDYCGDITPSDGVYSNFPFGEQQQQLQISENAFVDDGSESKRTTELIRRIRSRSLEGLKHERDRLLNSLKIASHWDITNAKHPFHGSICMSPCTKKRSQFEEMKSHHKSNKYIIASFSELWITPMGFIFAVSKCYEKLSSGKKKMIINLTSKENNRFVVQLDYMSFIPQFSNRIKLIESDNTDDAKKRELITKIIRKNNLIRKPREDSPEHLDRYFYVPDIYYFILLSESNPKPSTRLDSIRSSSSSVVNCGFPPRSQSQEEYLVKKVHSLIENGTLVRGTESFQSSNVNDKEESKQEEEEEPMEDIPLPESLPTLLGKRTKRSLDDGGETTLMMEPVKKSPKRESNHNLQDCLSKDLLMSSKMKFQSPLSDVIPVGEGFPRSLDELYTQTMEKIDSKQDCSEEFKFINDASSRLSQFLFTLQIMKTRFESFANAGTTSNDDEISMLLG